MLKYRICSNERTSSRGSRKMNALVRPLEQLQYIRIYKIKINMKIF
jgi:hypothetical protein